MKNCKTCQYLIQSKNHLDQGLCNKIVPIGNINKFKEGKLTLASEQGAAILSDELSWILVNTNNFGCVLHKDNNENISDENKTFSKKNSIRSTKTESVEDNL